MVLTTGQIVQYMEKIAPLHFEEDYDNSGLLIGREDKLVRKLMLAVDASEKVISQAISFQADLLLVHHPLIFHPLKNASEKDPVGRRVLEMAEARIGLYAAHTNLDSVPGGNIDHAAQMLGLQKVRAVGEDGEVACLRIGSLPKPLSLEDLGILIMKKWDLPYVRLAESSGSENRLHTSIALITGSGMDFADLAVKNGATVLVTGDISYHRADDAGRQGLSLIEASHFLTDRLSTIWLKEDLERMAAEAGCELIVQIAEERDVFRLVTR